MVNSLGNFKLNEDTNRAARLTATCKLLIMKRLLLPLLAVLTILTPATAGAEPIKPSNDFTSLFNTSLQDNKPLAVKPESKPKPAEPVKPVPVVYTVVDGDNLSKIGTAYNVEWQRLWAKNTQLTNPDLIHVGDQITVPLADEVLQRAIPATVSLPTATPGVAKPTPEATAGNFGGGNTYDYGYCTWYVKNRRGASLPNSLGNANTWYSRAQAMGMAVGSTPSPGAVGTTTAGSLGHVVYVESVNRDGTVNIAEMNYQGFGVESRRTVSAGEFLYIY